MRLLSIDPGTHTGWAEIDSDHDPMVLNFGTTDSDIEFFQLLDTGKFNDVDHVVFEDYKIRPSNLNKGWSHEWNSGPALQIIGAIKLWCFDYSIFYKAQQASIKPAAAGITGLPYKKGKANMHHIDAMLHGLYFLVKEGICTAPQVRVKNPVAKS